MMVGDTWDNVWVYNVGAMCGFTTWGQYVGLQRGGNVWVYNVGTHSKLKEEGGQQLE